MKDLYWAGFIAFALSFGLTPILRRLGSRVGLLDVPNERSSHVRPTPRTGGYAIFTGILTSGILVGATADRNVTIIMVGVGAAVVLSAANEFCPLLNWFRFLVQMAIAVPVIFLSHMVPTTLGVPGLNGFAAGPLAVCFSAIWAVAVLNGYNFMDGLNGIASAEAMVCGTTLMILALRTHDHPAAAVALATAAAAAGFLPWNLPSGSVFMGDVGSATFGLLFGFLVLRLSSGEVSFIAAALPLLPFLFDTGVTLMNRARKGEGFFSTAHRSHFYQRLNQKGFSHAAVTGIWTLLAISSSTVALGYDRWTPSARLIALIAILAVHVGLAMWITHRTARVA